MSRPCTGCAPSGYCAEAAAWAVLEAMSKLSVARGRSMVSMLGLARTAPRLYNTKSSPAGVRFSFSYKCNLPTRTGAKEIFIPST